VFKADRLVYHSTLGLMESIMACPGRRVPSSSSVLLFSLELSDKKSMSLKYEPSSEPLHISVK